MRFNVGGHVFLTRKRNFACFPFSRLGRLMRTKDSRYGIHPHEKEGEINIGESRSVFQASP